MEVLARTRQIISAFEAALGCCKVQKEIQWIDWCQPLSGYVKVNTYGAYFVTSGMAQVGGLLQDDSE